MKLFENVVGKGENIVGKAENAGKQHFLLFPPMFSTLPKQQIVKTIFNF